jgi:hypothetical protein
MTVAALIGRVSAVSSSSTAPASAVRAQKTQTKQQRKKVTIAVEPPQSLPAKVSKAEVAQEEPAAKAELRRALPRPESLLELVAPPSVSSASVRISLQDANFCAKAPF